jgi:riboflavin kinase/FMN adenylyltransferase
MRLIRSLDDFPDELRRGAVTIGNFDGVHRGHARIVERLIWHARQVSGSAIVFTFDPHPVRLLRPEAAPPPLTWTERKAELLAELGVDAMIAYPTDESLLRLSHREFFDSIIGGQLDAQVLIEGPNFHYGRNREGNVDTLAEMCRESGRTLEIVEPMLWRGDYVSSSRTRTLIQDGDVQDAARLLTRPYRLRGLVTHGARRGRQIGFPTANLDGIDTLLPSAGVYAGRAIAAHGKWAAAINIGPNPTFGERGLKFEAHLIGFEGSLYGQTMEVDILSRLRDIHPFDSVEQLKAQLQRDVADAARIAEERQTAEEGEGEADGS